MTCRLGERHRHARWCAGRQRRGFEAAAAARVAGILSELGQVPSDPRVGPAATPGPKSYRSTFTSQLLTQRAGNETLGLLHAWDAQGGTLAKTVCATYLDNGWDLCGKPDICALSGSRAAVV